MARSTGPGLVLHNANVLTMDTAKPRARLVAVRDGRILAAGGNSLLAEFKRPDTRVANCRGKTVLPGFNDAHCHFFALAHNLLSVDCSPAAVKSIADIQSSIKRHAATLPHGTWITATGYDEFRLAEKRHPTRHDLDQSTRDHPVRLLHRTRMACVLNTAALALAGVSAETPDTPGGLIDRYDTGEPNGILFHMNDWLEEVVPPLLQEELEHGVRQADQLNLACGITSFQDASISNDLRQWQMFRKLKEEKKLTGRVSVMPGFAALQEFIDSGLTSRQGDSGLRVGAVKLVVNEATGVLNPSQGELDKQVVHAARAGFQVAIHCIEANAVQSAVAALECCQAGGVALLRPRLEHCSVCPQPLVERMAAIGATVVSQPPFLYFNGDKYLSEVPPEEREWLYRFRSFAEKSLTVAGSSDSPVVGNNPLVGVYSAVTRKAQSGKSVLPEERVPASRALEMYTTAAAYASFDESEKGSITPGKLADMVVLSADPAQVPLDEIKDIKVDMTIVDGQVVYERV